MESAFDDYGRVYDVIYSDKDYTTEASYVAQLLAKHELPSGSLLEFGSGTGRHGNALAARGYNVRGIERSGEMLARVKESRGFTVEQGDIRSVRLGNTFDAVLSLFHVISYQVSNADVINVFSRAAEHLKPHGIFIFDVWYSPAVYTQGVENRIKRSETAQMSVVRVAEPVSDTKDNQVLVKYSIFVHSTQTGKTENMEECHRLRHFSLPEIDLFAQLTGFERIGAEEFGTGKAPDTTTWSVCVILRKL